MDVFTVQPEDVDTHWKWVRMFLYDVEKMAPGWTAEEVRKSLKRAESQLWVVREIEPTGIVVTRLGNVGPTKSGLVWIASGSALEEGLDMFRSYIEPWFRQQGCKLIEIVGRKGWKRVLPDYQEAGTWFVKEIA